MKKKPSNPKSPRSTKSPREPRRKTSAVEQLSSNRFEHGLRTLIRNDGAEAARRVSAALEAADANIATAAAALGCSYRTLRRWIATLRKAGHDVAPLQPRKDRPPLGDAPPARKPRKPQAPRGAHPA